MRYLLDTHVWLWLLEAPDRLGDEVRLRLEAADDLVLSVASVWEMAIKAQLGKLQLARGPSGTRDEILDAAGARELAIVSTHALRAAALPALHRDPFDRLLVAQAIEEGLVLVTGDSLVRQYDPSRVLWVGA